MKGKVERWNGSGGYGFIVGEDGAEYFTHEDEVIHGKIKRSSIVEFDVEKSEKSHDRAVNVVKIGHGKHHPFIQDLNRIQEVIEQCNMDDQERIYRLNDIQMLKNYFSEICDIDQFPDARKSFRPKISGDKANEIETD